LEEIGIAWKKGGKHEKTKTDDDSAGYNIENLPT